MWPFRWLLFRYFSTAVLNTQKKTNRLFTRPPGFFFIKLIWWVLSSTQLPAVLFLTVELDNNYSNNQIETKLFHDFYQNRWVIKFFLSYFVYYSTRRSRMGVLLECMTRLLGYFLSTVFFFVITGKALRQVASLSFPLSLLYTFFLQNRLYSIILCRFLLATLFLFSLGQTIVRPMFMNSFMSTGMVLQCSHGLNFFAVAIFIDL